MSDVAPRESPVQLAERSIPSSSGSSMNPEMERQYYREKVEHFKILIRKLQDENHSYKLRRESVETVSKLLQESKQELMELQKKCSTLDACIRTLQSRLEAHGLSSDLIPHEGEPYIPLQSKTLLDNLTRENKRLRNLVRSKSGDPEEFAKLQQLNDDLQREINELRIFTSNQQTRLAELEQVLRSSDNEKDRTINELTERLNHANRELSSRDQMCSSLAERSDMLQKQLEAVARQCQELAKSLQEKGLNTDKIVQTALKAGVTSSEAQSQAEEIKLLKQKLKEIEEMNKRWQVYNNQRETYVRTLVNEISDLKKRTSSQNNEVPQEVQIEMNRILDESRRLVRENDELKQTTTRASNERDRCKRELENAKGQITSLRTEIDQLRRQVESGGHNADSVETMNALKAQIRICTEDFESERRDRERAMNKLGKVEHDLERMKKENEGLRREIQRRQVTPTAQPQYNEPFRGYNMGGGPHGNFNSDGLAARGPTRQPEEDQQRMMDKYNVIDGNDVSHDGEIVTENTNKTADDSEETRVIVIPKRRTSNGSGQSLSSSSISPPDNLSASPPLMSPKTSRNGSPVFRDSESNSPVKSDNCLRCPKCDTVFKSDEHPELLEHMDTCVD